MRCPKIYVAGPSAKLQDFEVLFPKLREAGFEITFDWTVAIREAGSASPDDPVVCRKAAEDDLQGVLSADVFWIVQPDEASTSTGAWFEFGAAATQRKRTGSPMIIVSGASKKCIFRFLADSLFESHDEAFEYIVSSVRTCDHDL